VPPGGQLGGVTSGVIAHRKTSSCPETMDGYSIVSPPFHFKKTLFLEMLPLPVVIYSREGNIYWEDKKKGKVGENSPTVMNGS
jgi:hypothetical protein